MWPLLTKIDDLVIKIDLQPSLLNSKKGIDVKVKNEWSRGLSKTDRRYLNSISHQRLLPKNHKAFALRNGIIVSVDKKPVLGLFIRKTSPFLVENAMGKKFRINKKNILKSIRSNYSTSKHSKIVLSVPSRSIE